MNQCRILSYDFYHSSIAYSQSYFHHKSRHPHKKCPRNSAGIDYFNASASRSNASCSVARGQAILIRSKPSPSSPKMAPLSSQSFALLTIRSSRSASVSPSSLRSSQPLPENNHPLLHCIRRFHDPRSHATASGSVLAHENPCQPPRAAAHLHVFHVPQQNHISGNWFHAGQ